MENSKVYTVDDIRQILSISKNTAYNLIANEPPFRVIKIGGKYRIPKEGFYKWLSDDKSDDKDDN